MFTSLRVRNFRTFKDLTVEPLGRVNLIAGKNDVGKTALLEAMYTHCDPVNVATLARISELRGIEHNRTDDVAEWLLHDHTVAEGATIISQNDERSTRTSRIELVDAEAAGGPEYASARELAATIRPDLWLGQDRRVVLRYRSSTGAEAIGIDFLSAMGLQVRQKMRSDPIRCIFVSSAQQLALPDDQLRDRPENLLFSELEQDGRQEDLLVALRHLEPRLERLSLLIFNGEPTLHAQLEGMRRKVPIQFAGEGVRRLLLVSMAIATAQGGVVLIDEIENGLHHSALPDVWRAVGEAARRLGVQIFATTHSWECIRAAHEAFSSTEPYDLRLHRLDRLNGDIRAVTYDQTSLDTSIDMNMEVR